MRILLVSNMYPSRSRPEYGVFVAGLAEALRGRGHQVDEAVVRDPRPGALRTPFKYAMLTARACSLARDRPDAVYAHYLVPTGLSALLAARIAGAPAVITAHGQDVENARANPVMGVLTRQVLHRSAAVIAVSEYLSGRLPPGARRVEVIDCGVDTERFQPAPRAAGDGPRYLFIGSLTERKNPRRLLAAFAELGEGSLAVAGGGPLETELRSAAPAAVRFLGRLTPDGVRDALASADVLVAPSLVEPQGQVVLEGMACGRPVVATRVGGPAELVDERCGILVDPLDVGSIADGMRRAARLPVPCRAAVEVAEAHSRGLQAERIETLLEELTHRS
ncbi:MAG TPA: glycosyltransferase [Gaiellales bacterium]|nr:glycosyltransferase [Gaiellales bacterium]